MLMRVSPWDKNNGGQKSQQGAFVRGPRRDGNAVSGLFLAREQDDPERDERENGRPDPHDAQQEQVRDTDVDDTEKGAENQLAAGMPVLMRDRKLHFASHYSK
jgi:hypothetical protein